MLLERFDKRRARPEACEKNSSAKPAPVAAASAAMTSANASAPARKMLWRRCRRHSQRANTNGPRHFSGVLKSDLFRPVAISSSANSLFAILMSARVRSKVQYTAGGGGMHSAHSRGEIQWRKRLEGQRDLLIRAHLDGGRRNHVRRFVGGERAKRARRRSRTARCWSISCGRISDLTGTHVGCDTSQCGACVVHVDGKAVKSCTMLAAQASGSTVVTIEGLAERRRTASGAGGLQGASRPAMRLLHAGHDHGGDRHDQPPSRRARRGDGARRARRQYLPLHRLPQHRQGDTCRIADDGEESKARRRAA